MLYMALRAITVAHAAVACVIAADAIRHHLALQRSATGDFGMATSHALPDWSGLTSILPIRERIALLIWRLVSATV